MGIPAEGFISTVPEGEVVNRELPVPYEATWREGGDGSAMSSVVTRPHEERVIERAEADVELGITPGGKQLLATLRRLHVYGGVLLDSFSGKGSLEREGPEGFYFGRSGGNDLLEHGAAFTDAAQVVVSALRPNPVAPAGMAGETLFVTLYITVTSATGYELVVTPVLDGEPLSAEAVTIQGGGGEPPESQVHEIALGRDYDPGSGAVLRHGLRGTWFTFELTGEDLLEVGGDLVLENWELEFDPVRESLPGRGFAVESLVETSSFIPGNFFFGASGANSLYQAGQGQDDAGTAIRSVAEPNALAPAGASSECIFTNLYLAFTRANSTDLELQVVPILDNTRLEPISVTLEAVADPTTEALELPISRPHQVNGTEVGRQHPRGTWFTFELETVGGLPAERVVLEDAALEFEVVRESEEAVNAG